MLERRKFKVYRFKTNANAIIYVGYTGKTTPERFLEHVKDKYWIHKVTEVEECTYPNEAQARLVEMFYINSEKPIFNKKDKFSGDIKAKLSKGDQKFNTAFYSIDGKITTCIPKTNEGHTLVHFIEYNNHHIGLYYDECLNLRFSATDICKSLGIEESNLIKIAKNNKFLKETYNYTKDGARVNGKIYLCNYEDINSLIELSKLQDKISLRSKLSIVRRCSDFNYIYNNEAEATRISILIDYKLKGLIGEGYQDSDLKRLSIFKSLYLNQNIDNIISNYNEKAEAYEKRFPSEVLASEVFSMMEDVINEFGISYQDMFKDFEQHLKDLNINYWRLKNRTERDHNIANPKMHHVIAMNEKELYNVFVSYYEKHISED